VTSAQLQPATSTGVVRRWLLHVALVTCWVLVALMAVLTWGPHLTKYKTDIIIGQSMEPTIPLWSVIVAEPVDPAAIEVGDVIVAQPAELDGSKVTHRVVRIERGEQGERVLRTRGDNNETTDPWKVVYEAEGWRVAQHVPYVGWVMGKAQTRLARIALVVLPIMLILQQALRWIWTDGQPARPHDRDDLIVDFDDELDDDWMLTA
jgi:signal peptidase I